MHILYMRSLVYSALFGPEKIDNDEAEDILGISKDTIEQIRRYQRQRVQVRKHANLFGTIHVALKTLVGYLQKQQDDVNGYRDTNANLVGVRHGDDGKRSGGSASTRKVRQIQWSN